MEKLPPSSESEELESDFSSLGSFLSGRSDSQLTTGVVLPFSDLTGDVPFVGPFSSLLSSFLMFCKVRKLRFSDEYT